ncbi:MAG: DNA-directed RNA polymerase subunit A' [archaeon GW2011_AR17]|nr:MAG: DNA-directed RNA polymerase subunit A' [archaeon GW2011_AR17]MBS3153786.1 DNA-directed RNA polymerase subunit A' [Candidatus Woesearchaeota archaeon]HIH15188.1 DNA-directed RNA polymerase subunit A' [Nanoarchaeota archaeon]HIH59454.1 DNA-directed RNA polymerase subunit A' [Nanoarchaeota archaeon]HII13852.1 DNA-directed RNA polymerase subunit A' [Nanoarchaeota archaeon]
METVFKKVGSISFSLLSPQQIKKMAHVKIVTPELYDKEGYPVEGGLMDTRLGVIDPGLRCRTCNGKLKECPGHFGYIELGRPALHISYIKAIYVFLQTTCKECSRILLDDENIQKYQGKIDKLKEMGKDDLIPKVSKLARAGAKNVKKCPHCKAKLNVVKFEKPSTFMEETKRVSPIEILERFEKISDADCMLIGVNPQYARPEWMIMTVFPIPPVTMRPSITLETGERAEDDLTHKLSDIVRINQRLFENINAGAPEIIVEDLWDLLQYHITTFFNNDIAQVPPARHRSGQPLKTITERIKSKEGRFRHNLAGKRVNYAARTVISPDPKIELNEVGVPTLIAMELTVPERVTEWNLDWLKTFIKNGPKVYPGANYVLDGVKKKKITAETQEVILTELTPGQIVERHLLDGDISIFNRQPSLHRMSIMCHKIRVLPGKSFRLNPSVCNPYNADFDGDEMNLHIPQTEEARAEAEILMEVETQITSPKHGLNVIGCIEDAVTGNYLLTDDRTEMTKEEAIELLISIGVEDSKKLNKFKKKVTGKEIFSAVLPENFDFVNDKVTIENGQLKSGQIDPKTIGEDNGTLLRDINRSYSGSECVDIFGKIFKLGIAYLQKRGFTITTSDADIPEDIREKAKTIISDAITSANDIIDQYEKGKLKNLSGKTVEQTLELMVMQKLNETRNIVGKMISKTVSDTNNAIIMSRAGKGNVLNLAQTSILVGQQALRGGRIERGYKNRTLSLFREHDKSPEAKGFVRHSYKNGLNPVEFFFHAMTGRDSLMDTALRTPKSGYLYRRLANALQDLKVEYDGTVRDANKTIIQFAYGDDNIDVSRSENGTIDVKKIVNEVSKKTK